MLNVPALEQIKAQIVAYPESLDMCKFVKVKNCRTAACIAGWALLNAGKSVAEIEALECAGKVVGAAADILGLDIEIAYSAFHLTARPVPFRRRFLSGQDEDEVAIDIIDHLIANNGKF